MSRARDKCSAKALIDTLDTGLRIVEQVKSRGNLRSAPSLVQLEESLVDGKKDIVDALAKGTRRFGPGFGQGDLEAQLTLSQIIIEIQDTLLERLANPHEDDIAECIVVAERGCNDALIEMRHQHKRQLEQELAKVHKKLEVEDRRPVSQDGSYCSSQNDVAFEVHSYSEKQALLLSCQTVPAPIQTPQHQVPSPNGPASAKPKRDSGGFFRSALRSKSVAVPGEHILQTPPASPLNAQNTSKFRTRHASFLDQRHGYVPDSPRLSGDNLTQQTDMNGYYPSQPKPTRRHTESSIASSSSQPDDMSDVPEEVCKYARIVLEDKPTKGLIRANPALYSQNWYYQCKSTKCSFKGQAKVGKRNHILVDDNIYEACGVQYRWVLMAKSHCRYQGPSVWHPYQCLVCLQLGDKSSNYYGSESLLEHMLCHAGAQVGVVKFEGPLRFIKGAVIPSPDNFDVNIPKVIEKPPEKKLLPLQPPAVIRQQASVPIPTRDTSKDVFSPQFTASPPSSPQEQKNLVFAANRTTHIPMRPRAAPAEANTAERVVSLMKTENTRTKSGEQQPSQIVPTSNNTTSARANFADRKNSQTKTPTIPEGQRELRRMSTKSIQSISSYEDEPQPKSRSARAEGGRLSRSHVIEETAEPDTYNPAVRGVNRASTMNSQHSSLSWEADDIDKNPWND